MDIYGELLILPSWSVEHKLNNEPNTVNVMEKKPGIRLSLMNEESPAKYSIPMMLPGLNIIVIQGL